MPEYDFNTLSPLDFENLVRDLLQSELKIRLETFKVGRDYGIDLRYAKAGGESLIVQAKHYSGTGFDGLLKHMKTKEKAKIEALQPNRYVLATSVPLSPANKDRIIDVLTPHIKAPNDIYGREDLNNLLTLYPDVEKQHFKLWLSSISVLEEVIHSRILNQGRITLQNIKEKARLYVANQSFSKALEILKDYNYVVIAGIPGIGKTILAQMLILHFLRLDYEFVEVSNDISDAYTIPEHRSNRVYLYDDFLGRTSLTEKLQKNEDHRLVNFISAVKKNKTSKLILTTREYILAQARITYEVLNGPIFENPRCIIDLSQFTRPIKAQILYNHLYFSRLPLSYLEALVRSEAYFKIIDHSNYNPRIVEYMTDLDWLKMVGCDQPRNYTDVFFKNLEQPFLIWEQAFNNHLTDTAQNMLLVLGTLPREVFLEDFYRAVKMFIIYRNINFSEKEIRQALSELQGNFIVLMQDQGNDIVAFHNPSVKDFIDNYLEKNPTLYEELGKAVCFFEQVQWLCKRGITLIDGERMKTILFSAVSKALPAKPCSLINYSSDQGKSTYKSRQMKNIVGRLVFFASILIKKHKFEFLEEMFREILRKLTSHLLDSSFHNKDIVQLVKEVITLDFLNDLKFDFLIAVKKSLYNNADWMYDVLNLVEFFVICPEMRGTEDDELVIEIIDNKVEYLVDFDDPQFLSDELSTLEKIAQITGFNLETQIDSVRRQLSWAEENSPPDLDYDNDEYRRSSFNTQSIGNDDITGMFLTLLR